MGEKAIRTLAPFVFLCLRNFEDRRKIHLPWPYLALTPQERLCGGALILLSRWSLLAWGISSLLSNLYKVKKI
jgi:hypothetical protein